MLIHVRLVGYAIDDGEYRTDLAGAAAPVRAFQGGIVAALTVSGPADRLRPHLAEHAAATVRAALDLSARLGSPRS